MDQYTVAVGGGGRSRRSTGLGVVVGVGDGLPGSSVQRKRFNRSTLSVHSVQFSFIGAPKARCSPEPPMCETLLLRTQIPTRFATSD
jgi:hypothetical protein